MTQQFIPSGTSGKRIMFIEQHMPRLEALRPTPGMTHDHPVRRPYLLAEGALYGEVFMHAIRDAAAPWPKPKKGVENFAARRIVVDAMHFLFDPDDERRYAIGAMAGMTRIGVDRIIEALRGPDARGGHNTGIRPHLLTIVRQRADEWFPVRVSTVNRA